MKKIVKSDFFDRPPAPVAKDLIGKFLVRNIGQKEIALMITEVEAYDGPYDLASHARFGQTARTAPMFGEPGTIYVYFTYGMHWMLNIVCRQQGAPAAILIRGVETISGPARLTKTLKIDKSSNGLFLCKKAGILIKDKGVRIPKKHILITPRIGIGYAGAVWSKKPWRFVYKAK